MSLFDTCKGLHSRAKIEMEGVAPNLCFCFSPRVEVDGREDHVSFLHVDAHVVADSKAHLLLHVVRQSNSSTI